MDADRIARVRQRLEQIEASPALRARIMRAIAFGNLPLIITGQGDGMCSHDTPARPFTVHMPGEDT